MTTQSDRRWWRLDRGEILALTIAAMVCLTALVCTCIWTYGNRYQIGGADGSHVLDRLTGDVRVRGSLKGDKLYIDVDVDADADVDASVYHTGAIRSR